MPLTRARQERDRAAKEKKAREFLNLCAILAEDKEFLVLLSQCTKPPTLSACVFASQKSPKTKSIFPKRMPSRISKLSSEHILGSNYYLLRFNAYTKPFGKLHMAKPTESTSAEQLSRGRQRVRPFVIWFPLRRRHRSSAQCRSLSLTQWISLNRIWDSYAHMTESTESISTSASFFVGFLSQSASSLIESFPCPESTPFCIANRRPRSS
jgi:hypothetical protein